MGSLSGTAVRALLLAMTVVVVVVVSINRGFSLRDDVGVRWPAAGPAALWLLAWILWVPLSEAIGRRLGVPDVERWSPQAGVVLVGKAAAIVVLAPLAEELVFRGLLFHRIESGLGVVAAVLVTAGLFAVLHLQYGRTQLALVLLDGVVLGAARASTGSIVLTALLHALGNGFAVYQRLPA